MKSAVRKILQPIFFFFFQKWRQNLADSSEEQIFTLTESINKQTNINNAGRTLRYRFTVFPINENKVNCIWSILGP